MNILIILKCSKAIILSILFVLITSITCYGVEHNILFQEKHSFEIEYELNYYCKSPLIGATLAFLPGFGAGHFYGEFYIWGGLIAGTEIIPVITSIIFSSSERYGSPYASIFIFSQILVFSVIKLIEMISAPILIHFENEKGFFSNSNFGVLPSQNGVMFSFQQKF